RIFESYVADIFSNAQIIRRKDPRYLSFANAYCFGYIFNRQIRPIPLLIDKLFGGSEVDSIWILMLRPDEILKDSHECLFDLRRIYHLRCTKHSNSYAENSPTGCHHCSLVPII